jgi:hypothetical protein
MPVSTKAQNVCLYLRILLCSLYFAQRIQAQIVPVSLTVIILVSGVVVNFPETSKLTLPQGEAIPLRGWKKKCEHFLFEE